MFLVAIYRFYWLRLYPPAVAVVTPPAHHLSFPRILVLEDEVAFAKINIKLCLEVRGEQVP